MSDTKIINKNRVLRYKYLLLTTNTDTYYCKLTGSGNPGDLWYTFQFGGRKTYCVTLSLKGNTPSEAYLDRVEYDIRCNRDSSLEKRGGTSKLVFIALWVVVTFFPSIQNINLIDDSHIECIQGNKLKKMSLACDSILKYGMTWYERTFHAVLPNDLMNIYKQSLVVLDNPLDDFEYQSNRLPFLEKYKDIYKLSTTPKHFFEQLRKTYGDGYCEEVCDWIHKYIRILGIQWYNSNWFIPAESITKPLGFSMKEIKNPFQGGKYTRKRQRNVKYENTESNVGVYDTNYD